jgi:hypothetical protein
MKRALVEPPAVCEPLLDVQSGAEQESLHVVPAFPGERADDGFGG